MADAQKVETGADCPQDNIIKAGNQGPVVAHGNERIAGKGGNFQEDIKVKGITGNRHA